MANSVDQDQTAPIGAVCSGFTLFASILNLSVMLGNYLQQTTSANDIFRCIFFLGTLRVNFQLLPTQKPSQDNSFNLYQINRKSIEACVTFLDLEGFMVGGTSPIFTQRIFIVKIHSKNSNFLYDKAMLLLW